jgi:predicted acetyltransferase
LLWQPHPNTGEDAPVAFALIRDHATGTPYIQAFFVVPAARRGGLGLRFALDVIGRHAGSWQIPYQGGNAAAVGFWRSVARTAWGQNWSESIEAVPGKPEVPPDHWIRSFPDRSV